MRQLFSIGLGMSIIAAVAAFVAVHSTRHTVADHSPPGSEYALMGRVQDSYLDRAKSTSGVGSSTGANGSVEPDDGDGAGGGPAAPAGGEPAAVLPTTGTGPAQPGGFLGLGPSWGAIAPIVVGTVLTVGGVASLQLALATKSTAIKDPAKQQ